MNKNQKLQKQKKLLTLSKFIILIIILIAVPIYVAVFKSDVIARFENYNDVVKYIRSYGVYSRGVFILLQIMQIVISIIPGQLFQIAAGSIFGIMQGLLLSLLGVFLGEIFTFYLGKFLGKDGLKLFLGEEKMDSLTQKLNTEKAYFITFIFFLLPGVPKDLMCYVAGISNIKLHTFLIISLSGRFPIMLVSIVFGNMFITKNYVGMAIIAVLIGVLSVGCVLVRRRFSFIVDKIYDKIS